MTLTSKDIVPWATLIIAIGGGIMWAQSSYDGILNKLQGHDTAISAIQTSQEKMEKDIKHISNRFDDFIVLWTTHNPPDSTKHSEAQP